MTTLLQLIFFMLFVLYTTAPVAARGFVLSKLGVLIYISSLY